MALTERCLINRHLTTRPLSVPADIQRGKKVAEERPPGLYAELSVRSQLCALALDGLAGVGLARLRLHSDLARRIGLALRLHSALALSFGLGLGRDCRVLRHFGSLPHRSE